MTPHDQHEREKRRFGQGMIVASIVIVLLAILLAVLDCSIIPKREKYEPSEWLSTHINHRSGPRDPVTGLVGHGHVYTMIGPIDSLIDAACIESTPVFEHEGALYVQFTISDLATRRLELRHERFPGNALAVFHNDPEAGNVCDVVWAQVPGFTYEGK